jgi:hypothetical protein
MFDAELGERVDDRIRDSCQPGRNPAFAAARMPSGFVDGTSLSSVSNAGSRSARGIP